MLCLLLNILMLIVKKTLIGKASCHYRILKLKVTELYGQPMLQTKKGKVGEMLELSRSHAEL